MPRSPYSRLGSSLITTANQVKRQHTVGGNETLQSIAAYEFPGAGYNSEYWRQIAEENDVDDLDAITVGKVLDIPQPTSTT